jgi:hypothetical protein
MNADAKPAMKPGLQTLVAGLLIAAAGLLVLPAILLRPVFTSALERTQLVRFIGPGEATFKVEEAGDYYLWNDYSTVFQGKTYTRSAELPPGFEVSFHTSDGKMIELEPRRDIYFDLGDEAKRSVGSVTLEQSGELKVEIGGNFSPRVFSFGPFPFEGRMWQVVSGVILTGLVVLVGIMLALAGLVKRIRG